MALIMFLTVVSVLHAYGSGDSGGVLKERINHEIQKEKEAETLSMAAVDSSRYRFIVNCDICLNYR